MGCGKVAIFNASQVVELVVTLSTCFLVLISTAYCLLFAAHIRLDPPCQPHLF